MSVSPEVAARTLRAREDTRRAAAEARARDLREQLPPLAEALRGLGASEVWLFGSLAWGEPHLDSDVDLAISGLDGSQFVRALGIVDARIGSAYDLVDLDRASPAFAARIRDEGQRL